MSSNNNIIIASAEAESAVIGGLLLDNDKFDEIATQLNNDDFYLSAHQKIFEGISTLLKSGAPADLLTLEQYFKEKNCINEIGGMAYLAEVMNNVPSTINLSAYTQIMLRHSKQRRFLKLGQFIVKELSLPRSELDFGALEEKIDKDYSTLILQQPEEGAVDLKTAFQRIITRMDQAALNADPVSGAPTGITELDYLTTGGQPGELIIIAARPAMGKTTFAQVIAAATLDKYPDSSIQFYSQEMPADQLLERFMSMRAKVGLQSIRQATELNEEEWSKVAGAMGYIVKNWKDRLLIDDEASLTPYRLRVKIRKNMRLYGQPKAIFIDYIQLMRGSRKFENRNLELGEISGDLKKLAKEIGCPIYALSQLNRSLENRGDKRPINADLRDSGSLEQDADVIFHLYRDEVYHPNTEDRGIAEIIIGKQRNGPLGHVKCRFIGQYASFENLTGQDHQYE